VAALRCARDPCSSSISSRSFIVAPALQRSGESSTNSIVAGLVENPDRNAASRDWLLKFKPVNLGRAFPLYIALDGTLPRRCLWMMLRQPGTWNDASFGLRCGSPARQFGWNLPGLSPPGTWYFNPYCWAGAVLCSAPGGRRSAGPERISPIINATHSRFYFCLAYLVLGGW